MSGRALINVPKNAKRGQVLEIKTLISHVMESGFRHGTNGRDIPRDIITSFSARYNGEFKLVGAAYAAAPYGLAMAKGNGLDTAVLAALKVLMKNGTYQAIFNKWGLKSAAITNPKINAAIS